MNLYHWLSQCTHSLWQPVSCMNHGIRRCHSSRWIFNNSNESSNQLGSALKYLADAICNSLLWYRIDGDSIKSIRSCSIRSRSLPIQSTASGSHDCCRTHFRQDDASPTTSLYPDDRTQMGHLNGCLCLYRRCLRHIRRCAGGGRVHARRRVCSGLPSPTGTANRRLNGNSANYRRRQHPLRWGWETFASGSQSSLSESKNVFSNRCNNQRFEQVKFEISTTTIALSATNTHGMMSA